MWKFESLGLAWRKAPSSSDDRCGGNGRGGCVSYSRDVRQLMERISQTLDIDLDSEVSPRRPTLANSMFLTHKEQGDWAEELVIRAINEYAEGYHAVACGRSDALAAGDEGFEAFFKEYVDELNSIGKRPDILIFKEGEVPSPFDPLRRSHVRRAQWWHWRYVRVAFLRVSTRGTCENAQGQRRRPSMHCSIRLGRSPSTPCFRNGNQRYTGYSRLPQRRVSETWISGFPVCDRLPICGG